MDLDLVDPPGIGTVNPGFRAWGSSTNSAYAAEFALASEGTPAPKSGAPPDAAVGDDAPLPEYADADEVYTAGGIAIAEAGAAAEHGSGAGATSITAPRYAELDDQGPTYAVSPPLTCIDELGYVAALPTKPTPSEGVPVVRSRAQSLTLPVEAGSRVSVVDAPDYDTVEPEGPGATQGVSTTPALGSGALASTAGQGDDARTHSAVPPLGAQPASLLRQTAPPPDYVQPPSSVESAGVYSGGAAAQAPTAGPPFGAPNAVAVAALPSYAEPDDTDAEYAYSDPCGPP
jgi:hypothetical protein